MDCSQNICKTVICNVRSVSNFTPAGHRRSDISLARLLRAKYLFRHDAGIKQTAFVFLAPLAAEEHWRVCYYSHVLIECCGRQRSSEKKPCSPNSPLLPSLKSSFHTTAQCLRRRTLIRPNKNPDCIIYTLCLYSLTNCERTGSRVSQAAPAAPWSKPHINGSLSDKRGC